MNHTKWWNGPDWLTDKEKPVDHPVEIDKVKATADAKITHVNTTKIDRTKLRFCVKDVSELDTAVLRQSMITIGVNLILKKLARPTTQTVKFKNKEYTVKVTPAEDLREAKFTLIRQAQQQKYPNLYEALKRGHPVNIKSLDKLRLVFDKTNMIIRFVGKQEAMFSRQKILPQILLPPDHQVTKLIIWDLHKTEAMHLKGLTGLNQDGRRSRSR